MAVNIAELLTEDKPLKPLNTCRIGLELGQRHWEAVINCPQEILDEAGVRPYLRWNGPFHEIREKALTQFRKVSAAALAHNAFANVIYEAGPFGQELGRMMPKCNLLPWQIVARNIEYIRFGPGNRPVEKTDYFDACRLSQLDLHHSSLPYTDVQGPVEEKRRKMLSERTQLDKKVKRANNQLLARVRSLGVDSRHCSYRTWRSFIDGHDFDTYEKVSLNRLVDELELHQKSRDALIKEMDLESKEQSRNFIPPPPKQPKKDQLPSIHPLQPLGEDSPLKTMTLTDAIRAYKGFGLHTARIIDWSCGDIRKYKNEKALRKRCGHAPCNRHSCTIRRSAGTLHGDPRLRKLMIEAAWNWMRHQPESALAQKYALRIHGGTRRARKIAICALAGELIEALYKYLIHGKPIAGAVFKS